MENPTRPLDHYAALHISPDATEAEIIKAAKKRRIETHPDKYAGQNLTREELDAITTRAQRVGRAADVLCDANARREYDQELALWKAWQKSHGHEAAPSRAPSQSSRRDEGRKMSNLFKRHKDEHRGRNAAEADEEFRAPRPSTSTPARAETFRQDRDAGRQDRYAPRQERDSARADRDAPRQHRDSDRQDRQDPPAREKAGIPLSHIIRSANLEDLKRAGSARKSSRHGGEQKVRFEQNVRFASDAKSRDGPYR